jgi:DNA helicase-2/ATP-dependent DNA helicase PcrA
MANHLISNNISGIENPISVPMPENPDTQVIFIKSKAPNDSGLVDFIQPFIAQNELSQCAVLVRYYSAAIPIEIELAEKKIPYHTYGREGFLFIPEIACLYAALCLAVNTWPFPLDRYSEPRLVMSLLGALVSFPNAYLSDEDRFELVDEAIAHIGLNRGDKRLASALEDFFNKQVKIGKKISKPLDERAEVVRIFETGAFAMRPPLDALTAWVSLTNLNTAVNNTADNELKSERNANMKAFMDMAASYATIPEMLQSLDAMAVYQTEKPPEYAHIKILSIHRSKGLEFENVILAGWTYGSFPNALTDLQEERRLAYVAITRATERLVILSIQDNALDHEMSNLGKYFYSAGNNSKSMSPFIFEADPGLSIALANHIQSKEDTKCNWHVRNSSIAERYTSELGLDYTFIESDMGALYKASLPVPEIKRLVPGDQVWHPEHGKVFIVAFLYDPVYRVQSVPFGPQKMVVILPSHGWRLLQKE